MRRSYARGEHKYERGAHGGEDAEVVEDRASEYSDAGEEGFFFPIRDWARLEDPEAYENCKTDKELWAHLKKNGVPMVKDKRGVWGVEESNLPVGAGSS